MFGASWTWFNTYSTWLNNYIRPIYLLLYESLERDLLTELKKILDFLQFNTTTVAILCTVKNQEGNFHRKEKDIIDKNKNTVPVSSLYNKQMVASINKAITIVSRILKNKSNIELTDTVS